MSDTFPARVIRLDARGCLVRLDTALPDMEGDPHVLWCQVRGRIHLRDRTHQKSPVTVGDRVLVSRTAPDRGAVEEVQPRRSTLSRPANHSERVEHVMAANVDRVAIVSSADDPPFNPALVDRILVVVEYSNLEALIVINKMDLVDEPPPEVETYRSIGYDVVCASAVNGEGIDDLRTQLKDRVTLITGHSGVGKSSLLNVVQSGLGLVVGAVNEHTGRGTHTTTASVWVPLEVGGAVIDTAGIREFGLFGVPKRDLPWLFRDIAAIAPACRFPDCSHTHEPGCAVLEALQAGEIAPSRFDSYLRIVESLEEDKKS